MALSPIKGLIAGVRTMFGYHAASSKKRRSAPVTVTKSEDGALAKTDRRTVIANMREQRRNMALVRWMINTHLDYVSQFTFQATNKDQALNEKLESLMAWWSRAENCDVAKRHHLPRFLRLMEAHRTIDGDVGIHLTRTGAMQGIEGDRIGTPTSGMPDSLKNKPLVHGVRIGREGQALAYVINKRAEPNQFGASQSSQLTYERIIKARNLIMFGYYDRFDQIRGISPMAAASTTLTDIYEANDAQLTKAKMHALLGLAIMRQPESAAGIGEFDTTDADTGEEGTENTTAYKFELRSGLKLELEPGDTIDTIESKTPSQEYIDYIQFMLQIAIASLGLPMTFWDSRRSSYSAARVDIGRYQKSVDAKQADTKALLRQVTAWKLATWASAPNADGELMLPLPNGMLPRDITYEWVPSGIPWIQPLQEVNADMLAVSAGFRTRDDVCRERYGSRYADVVKTLGTEEAAAVTESATIAIGQPGQVTTRDEESANEVNKPTDADAPAQKKDNDDE